MTTRRIVYPLICSLLSVFLGDLEFQMASSEDKQKAEAAPNWIKVVAGWAKVQRRLYGVVAHGVRISNIDVNNQKETIQKIITQYARLHKKSKIKKIP